MTSRLGVLLDWTFADLIFVAIAVWQYISISLDLKRTKAREAAEKATEKANECSPTS